MGVIEIINDKISKLKKERDMMLDEYKTSLDVFYENVKAGKMNYGEFSIIENYFVALSITNEKIESLNQINMEAK